MTLRLLRYPIVVCVLATASPVKASQSAAIDPFARLYWVCLYESETAGLDGRAACRDVHARLTNQALEVIRPFFPRSLDARRSLVTALAWLERRPALWRRDDGRWRYTAAYLAYARCRAHSRITQMEANRGLVPRADVARDVCRTDRAAVALATATEAERRSRQDLYKLDGPIVPIAEVPESGDLSGFAPR